LQIELINNAGTGWINTEEACQGMKNAIDYQIDITKGGSYGNINCERG
jgi:hypothetical protein